MVPKQAHSTVLSIEKEAVIVAFRRHTLLPLDDCLYALLPTIPCLTRYRCLQRHGMSRLSNMRGQWRMASSSPTESKTPRHLITFFIWICWENGIEHRLTKIAPPWTNGQVERMNRTLKAATVKRYHYDTHDQLKTQLSETVDTDNYARRLKTLKRLSPCEDICKIWTSEPERFNVNPTHHLMGLYT